MDVELERIYDAGPRTGPRHRVLVDRLWPRGISKAKADLDEWLKDVAPSTELRRWYGHDVDLFDEFRRRYRDGSVDRRPPARWQLARPPRATASCCRHPRRRHSGAIVLEQVLTGLQR